MPITFVAEEEEKVSRNMDILPIYEVQFYSDRINTLVTRDPEMVADWLSFTERLHHRRLDHLIVGLDTEWRPNFGRRSNNPVAIIQICVGRRCLIFQILHCQKIPGKLHEFLGNEDYTFVGVGIEKDAKKLENDYAIYVGGNVIELGQLAAELYDKVSLKKAGLKALCAELLDRNMEKHEKVSTSNWDALWLAPVQVQYACIDAYVSFEIGKRLEAYRF